MRKFLPLVLVLAAACAPQIGGQMPMQAGHAVGYYIKKFDRSAMSLAPGDRRVPNTEFVVANNNPTSAMLSTMFGPLGPIVYAAAAQKSLAPEVEAHLSNPRIDLQAMMIKSLQTRAKSGVSVVAGEGDGRNAVILEPQCFLVTDDSGNGRLVTVVSANAYSESGSLVWRNIYRRESPAALAFVGPAGWFENDDQRLTAFLEESIGEISDEVLNATSA